MYYFFGSKLPQSRHNSPISDMDFQFFAKWTAQGSEGKNQLWINSNFWAFFFPVFMGVRTKKLLRIFKSVKKKAFSFTQASLGFWILSVRVERPWERFSYICLILSVPQFYIQLLYRPHLGTWILPFGLSGSKRKISETTEFLLKYATFLGVFFHVFMGKILIFQFSFYIVASALKSCIKWSYFIFIFFLKKLIMNF